MKHIVRDYLTFNKRERNGVIILVVIITLLIVYLNISSWFREPPQPVSISFIKELDSLEAVNTAIAENIPPEENDVPSLKSEQNRSYFYFDPNNLSEAEWRRLGLSPKQIRTIKNYESKGGQFRKKEDLKKMYCIKPQLYQELEPYIRIMSPPSVFEDGKVAKPPGEITLKKELPVLVDLNSADSATLTTIKGIGPFYAKNIIKYRNAIGGFYAKEQLMEIWKFDREKFDAIEKYITVNASSIRKININACDADALKGPYLKWNAANAIVNYRKQHGKFKTIEDIMNTDLVDEETLRKIAPYLILE
jgi:competence protein ComEA